MLSIVSAALYIVKATTAPLASSGSPFSLKWNDPTMPSTTSVAKSFSRMLSRVPSDAAIASSRISAACPWYIAYASSGLPLSAPAFG